jgi:hypothetical protein
LPFIPSEAIEAVLKASPAHSHSLDERIPHLLFIGESLAFGKSATARNRAGGQENNQRRPPYLAPKCRIHCTSAIAIRGLVDALGTSETLAGIETGATQKEDRMKTTSTISRVLLGLVFTVFGANGFLNLFSTGPVPSPLAGQFLGALVQSHYFIAVFVIEIVAGVALLANWKTPLALTLLGPVIVNILLFHITMAPAGLPPALFVTILWFVAAYRVRAAFEGLFHDGSAAERSNSRQSVTGLTRTA